MPETCFIYTTQFLGRVYKAIITFIADLQRTEQKNFEAAAMTILCACKHNLWLKLIFSFKKVYFYLQTFSLALYVKIQEPIFFFSIQLFESSTHRFFVLFNENAHGSNAYKVLQ